MTSSPDETAQLLARYLAADLYIAVAESLTGGELSAALTAPAGASRVVLGSLVVYQSPLKHELAGVASSLLEQQGAVDPEVAAQLALGCRQRLATAMGLASERVIGVSTTGVAGPDSQDGKPPGTVFIGLAWAEGGSERVAVYALELTGNRAEIRHQTVLRAMQALAEEPLAEPRKK